MTKTMIKIEQNINKRMDVQGSQGGKKPVK